MATVWVECWKCEACEHRWIKTELWPAQCSKCRSRKWNNLAGGSSTSEQHTDRSQKEAVAKQLSGVQVVGESPTLQLELRKPKPDMKSLQDICDGKGLGAIKYHSKEDFLEEAIASVPVKLCVVCDAPMRDLKGKWACSDVSCAKYGLEQRPK